MSRYRHLEFSADSPAPTPKEIVAIESILGAKLPRDFKQFLRAANGAPLYYSIEVQTPEGGEWVSFSHTFSTLGTDDDTFVGELEAVRRRWQVPPGVLPFAREDGRGSYVFLDLRPEGGGAVIALIERLQASPGQTQEPPFVRLADSFGDYIEQLQSDAAEPA